MSLRDKIEHAIQNQPCTVKDLKARFGGDRGADRKVMEALDALVHEAVVCQRSGVFFTVRSGRAEKALLCKVVKLGKNFAFVMLEDETSDIFIPGRFTRGAMPGDEVLVEKFEHPPCGGQRRGCHPRGAYREERPGGHGPPDRGPSEVRAGRLPGHLYAADAELRRRC